jgi:hypothetical protein
LREGNTHAALADLVAQVRLPRLLAEDRIVISELVRIAIGAIARTGTWEALQADGWTDEDLAALQAAWESQGFAAALAHSLEGERVFGDESSEMVRKSNEDAIAALYGLEEVFGVDDAERPTWERFARSLPCGEGVAEFSKKQVYCRLWRFAWSHQDQQHGLENMQRLIEITRTAAKEKSFASVRDAIDQLDEESLNRNLYDKLRYPNSQSLSALSRSVNKAMRAETERSMSICATALKRYSLRHGKLPASLHALVPDLVATVPVDYMDGQPLRYRLNRDGSFTLYSVGEDGKDDGGDALVLPGEKAIRNLWVRKDYVWPTPALPEEIEAYRQEAVKN